VVANFAASALADDVGAGRLTPDEAQTIATIVGKRAELFAWSSLRPRLTP